MAAAAVKVTGRTHVKPAAKLGRRAYQLTTFDLPYLAFHYNQKLLLYRHRDFSAAAAALKAALAAVLGDFHQLAGRLARDDDGVFHVEYADEMDGVEFSEAAGDAIGIDDLTAEDSPADTMRELVPYNATLNFEGLHRPLLVVQLTRLKDGLAIGCAFNHAVLDGTSTWHFMSAWASACSGSGPRPAPPFLDRTTARCGRMKMDAAMDHQPESSHGGANGAGPRLRERLFRFPESTIDGIKSRVNASGPARPFTTFQSLSAHVWRAVCRARGLRPEDPTVFTVFADCRRRLDPPLPESYFGNVIQAVFTGAAAGEVVARPVEFAAETIRGTVEGHDARTIVRRNEEWERNPVIFKFKDAGVNCVSVGSSPRFRVYEVDFGWGAAESVRSGANNRFDGMVYLYQGKGGGRSIDVEMTLDTAAMGRLVADRGFLAGEP